MDSILREQKFKTSSKPAGGYLIFKTQIACTLRKTLLLQNNQKWEDNWGLETDYLLPRLAEGSATQFLMQNQSVGL